MHDQEHPALALSQQLAAAGDVTAALRVLDDALVGADRAARVRLLLHKAGVLWADQGLAAGVKVAAEADALATEMAESDPRPRVYTLMTMVQMMASDGQLEGVAQLSGVLARVAKRAGAEHVAVQAWATRAEYLLAAGEWAEAESAASESVKIEADSKDARGGRARAYVVLGTSARHHGRAQRAVAMFRRALSEGLEPSPDFEVEFILARVRAGETGADITSGLDELSTSGPEQGRDAVRLARLEYWLRRGAFERADSAARHVPDTYAGHVLRARLAVQAGRPDQAAELAEALAAEAPDDARAVLLLGAAAVLCGEDEAAVGAFGRAEMLAREGGDTAIEVEAITRMGSLMLAVGQLSQARQRAREAIAAADGDLALEANGKLLKGLADVAGDRIDEGLAELASTSQALRVAGLDGRAAQVELHAALSGRAGADRERLSNAERLAQVAGDLRTLVLANVMAAFAAHAEGEHDVALERLARARSLDRDGQAGLSDAITRSFERLGLTAGTA